MVYIPTPLKNMKINWDDQKSQLNGKIKNHVPNHQPDYIISYQLENDLMISASHLPSQLPLADPALVDGPPHWSAPFDTAIPTSGN